MIKSLWSYTIFIKQLQENKIMKQQRERFNRSQYCRVTPDGDPNIYRVTHSAHKEYILNRERHERDTKELNVTFKMPVMTQPTEPKAINDMSVHELRVRFKEYRLFENEWVPLYKKSDTDLERLKVMITNASRWR